MSASRSALDPVEPGASRQNALLAYQHFEALPLRGLAQLVGTRVAETPIAIDDVNGEPLFHDYPLQQADADWLAETGCGSQQIFPFATRAPRSMLWP